MDISGEEKHQQMYETSSRYIEWVTDKMLENSTANRGPVLAGLQVFGITTSSYICGRVSMEFQAYIQQ